jgi:cobalt-zinc-cadmium efflux system protein
MPHDHADHAHDHHGHDHGHGHSNDHGHHHGPGGHSHAPKDFGRAFAIGATLNIGFVIAETIAGLMTHSLALLADAGHNLSDVLGLFMAWGAVILAKRAPAGRHTYGLRKGTILASLTNAVVLLVAVGAIAWEAVRRFADPQPIEAGPVMIVAAIGIVINTATALMFMKGSKDDLNIRGAFLHMAADAAISAGVVVAAAAMWATGWLWLDPVVSLGIVVVIVLGTWGLLRDSLDLALDAAPRGIDPKAVGLAGRPPRRQRGARPAHLGDEHHRDGHDRPSGPPRKPRQRPVPARYLRRDGQALQDRPRHHPGRERRRRHLPPGRRGRGVSLPLSLALYRAATTALEPFAPLLLNRRAKAGKEDRARLHERLGRPKTVRPEGRLVWLHGASVGESLSILPLVERLRAERPDVAVLVTSGTVTSAELLARRLPAGRSTSSCRSTRRAAPGGSWATGGRTWRCSSRASCGPTCC